MCQIDGIMTGQKIASFLNTHCRPNGVLAQLAAHILIDRLAYRPAETPNFAGIRSRADNFGAIRTWGEAELVTLHQLGRLT